MYTLRFSNSARPSFPAYARAHETPDAVACEILRVRASLDSAADAHHWIVEDKNGDEIITPVYDAIAEARR